MRNKSTQYALYALMVMLLCFETKGSEQNEQFRIVLGTIPHVLHVDQPGPHNQIYEDLILPSLGSYDLPVSIPYYRALRDFIAGEANCIFIGTDDPAIYASLPENQNRLIFSDHINSIHLHAYTRRTDPIAQDYNDLSGKVVLGVRTQLRALIPALEQYGIDILFAVDLEKAYRLLDHGRGDAVITFSMDTKVLMDSRAQPTGNEPMYHHDPNFKLATWNEVITCWNTPNAKAFLSRFNNRLAVYKRAGSLDQLFTDYK